MNAVLKLVPVLSLLLAAPGCDAEDAQSVGPRGGIVTSPDGRVMLDIPAGALDEDIVVTIEAVDDAPDGAFGSAYEIEPRLTMLKFPAELTFDLEADAQARLLPDEMANAMLVTEDAQGWSRLPDLEVDGEAGLATASVLYFSTYAVVL